MDPEGARLLSYAYGKPRLCINIHHSTPLHAVLQQAQRHTSCCNRPLWCTLCYMHCAGSILRSIKNI